jgi:hypothetical protein
MGKLMNMSWRDRYLWQTPRFAWFQGRISIVDSSAGRDEIHQVGEGIGRPRLGYS